MTEHTYACQRCGDTAPFDREVDPATVLCGMCAGRAWMDALARLEAKRQRRESWEARLDRADAARYAAKEMGGVYAQTSAPEPSAAPEQPLSGPQAPTSAAP